MCNAHCAYKRVSLHNTCWLKYSPRWRQWCFQCRCCLAYEGLASAGDEGAIVGSCIDEGKNRKCVFQNIKFAEDSSSEMVRQQSFKSVFYFELWVDRVVSSVWPAKYNFRVEKFKISTRCKFHKENASPGIFIRMRNVKIRTIQLLRSPFPKF